MLYHMTQVLVGIPYDYTEKLTYVNRTFQFFHNLLSLKTNYVRSFHLLLSKCLENMINYMLEGNKYKIPYQIAYWTKSNYTFNFWCWWLAIGRVGRGVGVGGETGILTLPSCVLATVNSTSLTEYACFHWKFFLHIAWMQHQKHSKKPGEGTFSFNFHIYLIEIKFYPL